MKKAGTLYWIAAAGVVGYLLWKNSQQVTAAQIAAANATRASAGQLPASASVPFTGP